MHLGRILLSVSLAAWPGQGFTPIAFPARARSVVVVVAAEKTNRDDYGEVSSNNCNFSKGEEPPEKCRRSENPAVDRRTAMSNIVTRASFVGGATSVATATTCSCCLGGGVAPAYALAQITQRSQEDLMRYDLPRNILQDAAFAQGMAIGMIDYEREAYPTKKRLFESLFQSLSDIKEPTIVEVGMGSFPNALYYKKAATSKQSLDLIGIDPNDRMGGYAKDNAARAGILQSSSTTDSTNNNINNSLRIIHGVSEALPLEDNSCDAVVCTLTLCSVVDPAKSVAEIRRVLKPGGKFLFWEHVLSETNPALATKQIQATPAQIRLADGCHLDRRTGETIRSAGFQKLDLEYIELNNFQLLNPTVCGIATA